MILCIILALLFSYFVYAELKGGGYTYDLGLYVILAAGFMLLIILMILYRLT